MTRKEELEKELRHLLERGYPASPFKHLAEVARERLKPGFVGICTVDTAQHASLLFDQYVCIAEGHEHYEPQIPRGVGHEGTFVFAKGLFAPDRGDLMHDMIRFTPERTDNAPLTATVNFSRDQSEPPGRYLMNYLMPCFQEDSVTPIPVLNSKLPIEKIVPVSDVRAPVSAMLDKFEMPANEYGNWDVIQEIRADRVSLQKCRRIRRLLLDELQGSDFARAENEISIRLEEYELAMKKHGMDTVSGLAELVFDEKHVVGTLVAALAGSTVGNGTAAAIAASATLVTQVGLKVFKNRYAKQRLWASSSGEVAYLFDTANKLKNTRET